MNVIGCFSIMNKCLYFCYINSGIWLVSQLWGLHRWPLRSSSSDCHKNPWGATFEMVWSAQCPLGVDEHLLNYRFSFSIAFRLVLMKSSLRVLFLHRNHRAVPWWVLLPKRHLCVWLLLQRACRICNKIDELGRIMNGI